jgi:signal recognition particle receptor subunit beta
VLVDTRRLEDSFEVFDQLELRTGMPFAVAINDFPGAPRYDIEQLRTALDLLPETPIVVCDARSKESSAAALITLVEHALRFPVTTKALA